MFPSHPIHKKNDPNQGITIVVLCCTSKTIYVMCHLQEAK